MSEDIEEMAKYSELYRKRRHILREEQKRILKICVTKLQLIADPESSLCRSVLINNTLRSLQQLHADSRHRRGGGKRQQQVRCDEEDDDGDCKRQRLEEQLQEEDSDDLEDEDDDDDDAEEEEEELPHAEDPADDMSPCRGPPAADVDIWCSDPQDQDGQDTHCDEDTNTSISGSLGFSLTSIDYYQQEEEESSDDNSQLIHSEVVEAEDFSVKYSDTLSTHLIHSNSISLQS